MVSAALSGFALGATLIIAIGAQNAYILRQGLMRQHVFILCLICACSDAFLILLGVAGFGTLVQSAPLLLATATFGGAAFLFWLSYQSAKRALRPDAMLPTDAPPQSLRKATLTVLALTWLNPHVYLDTVVALGAISGSYGPDRFAFGGGAMLASFVWFFGLGYGARLLQPIFARPKSWQILDAFIAFVMSAIAIMLILDWLN